eukprot:TRINITY_DN2767_c0_g1_i1.p1 TRINITY_DN2767_c0_g1~~TRINITY_DN2767_c0_g1_i1.p1  ORF type:complete len:621 (+),score=141.37 TRINITY_DN2767_c0_g1_i1:57-1865(+)
MSENERTNRFAYDPLNSPKAIAIEDFSSSGKPAHLELKKGDVVSLYKFKTPPGWLAGEREGKFGLFPAKAVQTVSPKKHVKSLELYKKKESVKKKKDKRGKSVDATSKKKLEKSVKRIKKSKMVQEAFFFGQRRSITMNNRDLDRVRKEMELNTSKVLVRALYPFMSGGPKQLAFDEGEEFYLLEKNPSGWWKGEKNGIIGHFPGTYVEEVNSPKGSPKGSMKESPSADDSPRIHSSHKKLPIKARARVLYNFKARRDSELSLEMGDSVAVYKSEANGWLYGECNGSIGYFPLLYVELEDQHSEMLSPELEPIHKPNLLLSPDGSRSPKEQPDSTTPRSEAKQVVALYTYRAPNDYQISFDKGDKITVLKDLDQSWSRGKIGNKIGLFPRSYAKYMSDDSEKTDKTPDDAGGFPSDLNKRQLLINIARARSTDLLNRLADESENKKEPRPKERTLHRRSKTAGSSPDLRNSMPEKSPRSRHLNENIVKIAPLLSKTPKAQSSGSLSRTPVSETDQRGIEANKRALLNLQQQTAHAINTLKSKLEAEERERLKLEQGMRDLMRSFMNEQELRKKLEDQSQTLMQEFNELKTIVEDLMRRTNKQ